ncbi:uncharacterized protein BXIN_1240 [Babesia sp. Xinjiang]|uniref:uncharacterized protein n=1 Tax=Babesia sp. Xinjiang TaxID=462227 RepID=UPI000A237352|nr:uncharacterized protein BXIN_1240 [Babesia sp. Xinjiang]ORM39999.1 hypothetical protein BXIN_1240 [Babesia sp. Xinjiang]
MKLAAPLLKRHLPSHRSNIIVSLEAFKQLVAEQSRCSITYEGWPPPSRIIVGNGSFAPFGRNIFVMRRALKDGMRTEPTLVLCCGTRPTLMFRRSEFEALVKHLPWIKNQLREFYKLI